jgi:hypothetical protein
MRMLPLAALVASSAFLVSAPVQAQESRTAALAKELAGLLDRGKLDSIASREQGSEDRFVAALYFPGAQMLVISAKYAAPPLLNEKIVNRQYREVYLDLNAATDPASRVVIEDFQANGIRPDREDDQPFDFYTKGSGSRVQFDGDYKKQQLSEDAYTKAFAEAEAVYGRMLESLIAQVKGSGS